jgi:hypothetical protein
MGRGWQANGDTETSFLKVLDRLFPDTLAERIRLGLVVGRGVIVRSHSNLANGKHVDRTALRLVLCVAANRHESAANKHEGPKHWLSPALLGDRWAARVNSCPFNFV